jgi:hypothetical protein
MENYMHKEYLAVIEWMSLANLMKTDRIKKVLQPCACRIQL